MTGAGPARIAVFGDAMIDYAVHIDSSGARDEKYAVHRSARTLGGGGANTAIAITRVLGPGSAELYATVSDDPWGAWIADRLTELGVGVTHLRAVPGAVPHAVIVHDGADRRLLVDRGVADDVVVPAAGALAGHRLVFVCNPVAVLPLSLPSGVTLVVGLEHQMVPAVDPDALTRADVIVTNTAGWQAMGPAVRHGTVVVTAGAGGAAVYRDGAMIHRVDGHDVVVCDATGAGDAFAGALCAALATGHDLATAVARANAIGAVAVTTMGAPLGPVDLDDFTSSDHQEGRQL
jgi:ribokinase